MQSIRLHMTNSDIERSELQVVARLIAFFIAAERDSIRAVNDLSSMLESSLAALQLSAGPSDDSPRAELIERPFWDILVRYEHGGSSTQVAQMDSDDRMLLQNRFEAGTTAARVRLSESSDEYLVVITPAGVLSCV